MPRFDSPAFAVSYAHGSQKSFASQAYNDLHPFGRAQVCNNCWGVSIQAHRMMAKKRYREKHILGCCYRCARLKIKVDSF
jgi:hypothetical protein